MGYSFDTSGFLDARARYYPPDVFPTLWDRMDASVANGTIFTCEEVFRELERKDDDVYQWVKARPAMIVPIDEDIQLEVVNIMRSYPRLVDTKRNKSGGDPWVIALAISKNLSVVTAEAPSGTLEKPRIPDVCDAMGIRCFTVLDFFRNMGWRV